MLKWATVVRGAVTVMAVGAGMLYATDALAVTDVCYQGGALLPNFRLNGNATLNGTDLIVTTATGAQDSSLMYVPKFSTANDIHVLLEIKISSNGGGGADGMAFVMHNDPRGSLALGAPGGGVGYQGIVNSVVVEFDTYQNAWDPSANHIALTKGGSANHSDPINAGLPVVNLNTLDPVINLKGGAPVWLWIDWNHTTTAMSVYLSASSTKPATASLATTIDLATALGGTFYAGFTGSTGGSWSQHEVVNLYASDHLLDPTAACCTTDASCAGSASGPVCDTTKHLCGQCTANNAANCPTSAPACDLAQSSNQCASTCTSNFGATGTAPCASSTFPVCSAGGSCTSCSGDLGVTTTASCAAGAPYCSPAGYCGLCTTNGDCTSTNATHAGVVCNTTTGTCVGTCSADAQCGPGNQCTAGVCASILIGNGNACGALGPVTCASGVCDSADNKCGYASGDGVCTSGNASVVCRSGVCGASSAKCIPAGGSGCASDADCGTSRYCDGNTFTCTNKLANGSALPSDPLHSGTCSSNAGTSVCVTGSCDPIDNACGRRESDSCASDSQCRTGVCVTSGANQGKCEPCMADGQCSGTTPACNTTTNHCVACTATRLDACTGITPVCDVQTSSCAGCTSDFGQPAASCPSNSAPFCASDHTCSKCTSNAQCAGASHGGPICNSASGACGNQCSTDVDCGSQWCNNPSAAVGGGTCAAKLANGIALPNSPPINGACTAGAAGSGLRVCTSGVCDLAANVCGLTRGASCSSDVVCISGVCAADGACGLPNGSACTAAQTCRSGVCDSDGKCGYRNGGGSCLQAAAIATDAGVDASGVSDANLSDGSLVDGAAQRDPTVCRAGVCGTDGTCGLPDGASCAADANCRSALCRVGVCTTPVDGGDASAGDANAPFDAAEASSRDSTSDASDATDAIDAIAESGDAGVADGSVASDASPPDGSLVASHDVTIEGGGCSCSTSARESGGAPKAGALLLIGALLVWRRRMVRTLNARA